MKIKNILGSSVLGISLLCGSGCKEKTLISTKTVVYNNPISAFEACLYHNGYVPIHVNYDYNFKDSVIYSDNSYAKIQNPLMQDMNFIKGKEKNNVIRVGIEGRVGAGFEFRRGGFDIYNYDPTDCSYVYKIGKDFFDRKSILRVAIENRGDAKRLVEAFKKYVSENEWIGIEKEEMKIIEKEIMK